MVWRILFLVISFALVAPAHGVAVDDARFDDPALEARARTLMREVRCLVCQNQSIDDSNAELAQDLRAIVRERILAGDSDVEIRSFLVARYGDWVLLEPPIKPSTYVLWALPVLALLGGGSAIILSRRKRPAARTAHVSADQRAAALARLHGQNNDQRKTL